MASAAYDEHDGENRQLGGVYGGTNRWEARIRTNSRRVITPAPLETFASAADDPRLPQKAAHSLTQRSERRIGCRDARHQHNVEPTGHSIPLQTNRFTHAAAYPVTAHGAARAPSHGDADARHRQAVGPRV